MAFLQESGTLGAAQHERSERRFFGVGALVALAIVFSGFAPSYYLKTYFGTPELPSALVHVHGLVMTAWFALFLVQVRLIAAHRSDLHRRIGFAGIALAALVLVVGTLTAVAAAKAGRSPPGVAPLAFLAIPLGDMLVFAILFGLAVAFRRHADFHKRYMLLASLSMLTAAIARVEPLQGGGLPAFFGAMDLIVLGFVAWDVLRMRRLHPAFLAGFLVILVSQVVRFAGAGTPEWLRFAAWLTR